MTRADDLYDEYWNSLTRADLDRMAEEYDSREQAEDDWKYRGVLPDLRRPEMKNGQRTHIEYVPVFDDNDPRVSGYSQIHDMVSETAAFLHHKNEQLGAERSEH